MDIFELVNRSYETLPKYKNETSRAIEVVHVSDNNEFEVRMYLYANKKRYTHGIFIYDEDLRRSEDREELINMFMKNLTRRLLNEIIDRG